MMPTDTPRLLHRLALAMLATAVLPILFGALTTTKEAGMAFPDWPSSDGQGMFAYPWLRSVGDKFLEHGHRLAGVLIGVVSIAVVVVAGLVERRGWVKVLAGSILLCVIAQGLLGGQRVLLNARGLAFVHGSFAALVFGLMGALVVVTSRGWFSALTRADGDTEEGPNRGADLGKLKWLATATMVVLFVQYVLGGLVRHHGLVLYEHVGGAMVSFLMTVFLAGGSAMGPSQWLKAPAFGLALAIMFQLFLGLGAWVTKFGMPGLVDVVVAQSPWQVFFRTAHVLGGMLVFLMATVLTLRIWRLAGATRGVAVVTGSRELVTSGGRA
jgi:heme a synthase